MKTKNSRHWRTVTLATIATAALGLGGLALVTSVTAASLSDQANLNIGESGIGSGDRFDIGVVLPSGTVEQADPPRGFDWVVGGSQELTPGHSVTTTIPVFNNTPKLNAATSFEILLRNGDGAVSTSVPNITEFLRFTAEVDGQVLFQDVTWDAAQGVVGTLTARGSAPLAEGDTYTAGPSGSEQSVLLTITYLDVAGVEAFNGGQSALSLRFMAESVKP